VPTADENETMMVVPERPESRSTSPLAGPSMFFGRTKKERAHIVRAPGEDHPDVTRAGAFPPLQPPYCSQRPYRLLGEYACDVSCEVRGQAENSQSR
jgi:hypothetical protein